MAKKGAEKKPATDKKGGDKKGGDKKGKNTKDKSTDDDGKDAGQSKVCSLNSFICPLPGLISFAESSRNLG